MTKIPFKAVAVDLDGTFLTEKKTFDHALFAKVLRKLQANQIPFICATGNQLIRSHELFDKQGDELVNRYSIVYNKESDKLIMYTKGKILFEGNISDIEEVENLLADYYTYDRDNLDESYNSSANKLKALRQIYNDKHNQ